MDQENYHIQVSGLWKVFGNSPERALEPEHASKSRDDIQEELGLVIGLRDLSFSVLRGQTFVVMGLSGSGKSTLGALSDQADRSYTGTDPVRWRRHSELLAGGFEAVSARQDCDGFSELRSSSSPPRAGQCGIRP